jgi:hypothetical protein
LSQGLYGAPHTLIYPETTRGLLVSQAKHRPLLADIVEKVGVAIDLKSDSLLL